MEPIINLLNAKCKSTSRCPLRAAGEASDADNFDQSKLYSVALQGLNTADSVIKSSTLTDTVHPFILICQDNDWYIIDTYLDVRSLSQRKIQIDDMKTSINSCITSFNRDQWKLFFDCQTTEDSTIRCDCHVNDYSYTNHSNFIAVVNDLVDKVLYRLDHSIDGKNLKFLCLLHQNCDIGQSRAYLLNSYV